MAARPAQCVQKHFRQSLIATGDQNNSGHCEMYGFRFSGQIAARTSSPRPEGRIHPSGNPGRNKTTRRFPAGRVLKLGAAYCGGADGAGNIRLMAKRIPSVSSYKKAMVGETPSWRKTSLRSKLFQTSTILPLTTRNLLLPRTLMRFPVGLSRPLPFPV